MSDEPTTEKTAVTVGQKIASTELSIPLNIPLTKQQPPETADSPSTPSSEGATPPANQASQGTDAASAAPSQETSSDSPQQDSSSAEPATPDSSQSTSSDTQTPEGPAAPPAPSSTDDSPSLLSDQSGEIPEQTKAKEQLSEAIKNVAPITVAATPEDAKAATNPLVKFLVAIGAAVSLIGLIGILIFGIVAGLSILVLGVLIVVGGVLSPKPKQ